MKYLLMILLVWPMVGCKPKVDPNLTSTKTMSKPEKKELFDCLKRGTCLLEADRKFLRHNYEETLSTVKILKKMVEEKSPNSEVYWRICRALIWLYEHETDKTKKNTYATDSLEYSKKALLLRPKEAESYYYYAISLGIYSQMHMLEAIRNVKKIIEAAEEAVEINPSLDYGGPHRLLGSIYLEAPETMGGDIDRSLFHFKKALEKGGDLAENLLGLAKAYIYNEQREEAKILLEKILWGKSFVDTPHCLSQLRKEATHLLSLEANKKK